MANEYTWGDKLQGIGAVLGGTVPQFQKQMGELSTERQKAMYQDADAALKMATRGDLPGVIRLIEDRISMIQRLNGDPTESLQALNFARAAQSGDTASGEKLMQGLSMSEKQGIDLGFIAAPVAPKYLSTEQGMMLFQNPDGTIETKPISEDAGWVDPEEKQESLRAVRQNVIALSKNAQEVTSAYNKVRGLESEMRNGSRAAINAGIMNVARLISPGVVTDRDAASLSGAGTTIGEIYSFLSGKGVSVDDLMRIVDPANPDTFSVDQLIAVANKVTSSQIPSIMTGYEDQRSVAENYGASLAFKKSYFEDQQTFSDLQGIYDRVSGTSQNAGNAPLSFNSEQEAGYFSNTSGIPDGTKIVINGITGTWMNQ